MREQEGRNCQQFVCHILAIGNRAPFYSPWDSGLVKVRKKQGGVRLRCEFSQISDVTLKNAMSFRWID